jgi:hypothetical protein
MVPGPLKDKSSALPSEREPDTLKSLVIENGVLPHVIGRKVYLSTNE